MADDNFRSYRRDPLARDNANPLAQDAASDPLAELARLIGQSDPYAERGAHDSYDPARSGDGAEAPALEWAANDGYDARTYREEDRYAAPPPPPLPQAPPPLPPSASYPPYPPQARGYEDEPPAGDRYFSGPAARFDGFSESADVHDPHGQHDYAPEPPPERYDGAAYAADDYYDEHPAPRSQNGMIVVMAVLGLAVVGVAGAFAYRAMFGSAVWPTLPPIIRAMNGPNKIMPNYGEAQVNAAAQAALAAAGANEKVVSREEQPLNMEPPKVNSRIVSTIPVAAAQNPPAPTPASSAAVPAATPQAAPIASPPPAPAAGGAPPAPISATSPPAPARPMAAPPAPAQSVPAAPATASSPSAAPVPASAPASTEPRKVHTVTIRADQPANPAAAPAAPASPPPVRTAAMRAPAPPAPRPSAPPVGANAPLSIVPGAEGDVATPIPTTRTRLAAAPMAVASAAPVATPVSGVAAPAAPGGRYTVQVSSQRSEAEAQASLQVLRAKFPTQIGARQPIIKRADLGAKGVYYRALIGPFASAEQAAGMCSSLKAAGGNCLVQRN